LRSLTNPVVEKEKLMASRKEELEKRLEIVRKQTPDTRHTIGPVPVNGGHADYLNWFRKLKPGTSGAAASSVPISRIDESE
jgi:hypothetical protein